MIANQSQVLQHKGFTLVELLAVLGIVMIVVGLSIPSLRGAMFRARQARELLHTANLAATCTLYVNDWKEIYPLGNDNAIRCTQAWNVALQAGGYISNLSDVDPDGYKTLPFSRYIQSMAMTCDPALMIQGHTRPEAEVKASAITVSAIVYPSRKGWINLLCYKCPRVYTTERDYFCCAGVGADVPAAMADGSTRIVNRYMLDWHAKQITVVDQVGVPLQSTWGGCLSWDLR